MARASGGWIVEDWRSVTIDGGESPIRGTRRWLHDGKGPLKRVAGSSGYVVRIEAYIDLVRAKLQPHPTTSWSRDWVNETCWSVVVVVNNGTHTNIETSEGRSRTWSWTSTQKRITRRVNKALRGAEWPARIVITDDL